MNFLRRALPSIDAHCLRLAQCRFSTPLNRSASSFPLLPKQRLEFRFNGSLRKQIWAFSIPSRFKMQCRTLSQARDLTRLASPSQVHSSQIAFFNSSRKTHITRFNFLRQNWYSGNSSWSSSSSSSYNLPIIPIIIGVNVGVFLLWQYGERSYMHFKDGRIIQFMSSNMCVSFDALRSGRLWTLISSSVTHKDLMHLLINMVVLYSFGPVVLGTLGLRAFGAFYLGTAGISSLGHAAYYRLKQSKSDPYSSYVSACGASGVITGMTTFFALSNPTATVTLFFLIPVPALVAVGGFVAYDFYRAASGHTGGVSSSGHLGGAAAGAAYYWWWSKGSGMYNRWARGRRIGRLRL